MVRFGYPVAGKSTRCRRYKIATSKVSMTSFLLESTSRFPITVVMYLLQHYCEKCLMVTAGFKTSTSGSVVRTRWSIIQHLTFKLSMSTSEKYSVSFNYWSVVVKWIIKSLQFWIDNTAYLGIHFFSDSTDTPLPGIPLVHTFYKIKN